MSAENDLKVSVEKFIADVEAYKASVAAAVDKAVRDALAGRDVDVNALKAEVDAADASLTAAQPAAGADLVA